MARGKTLYGINCQGCHGQDLRGGDLGGPNLLRSQVALSDQDGELIVPIIQGARQSMGMPKIELSLDDSKTVAAYVRSVIATIGVREFLRRTEASQHRDRQCGRGRGLLQPEM